MSDATEEWRPIPDWDGLYEASSLGRIRSLPRRTPSGPRGGRILKQNPTRLGYLQVGLRSAPLNSTRPVHVLVAAAFLGERPEGQVVRHLNDDRLNNAITNLAYGTHSDNMFDKVANGRNPNKQKTHCSRNHEYTPENTRINAVGKRTCRACRREDEPAALQRRMELSPEKVRAASRARTQRYRDRKRRERMGESVPAA